MKSFPRFFDARLSLWPLRSVRLYFSHNIIFKPIWSRICQAWRRTLQISLKNPWGLSRGTTSPWWISDNGTGLATLYDGNGVLQQLQVTIPSDLSQSPTGTPTGTVFNGSPAFAVGPNAPAIFLFVSEDGTISGWNPTVSLHAAIAKVRQSTKSVFKRATIATDGISHRLFVADFRQGKILVYDSDFKPVPTLPGAFFDFVSKFGFAPFNIQNIGGNRYVGFAKQDSAKHDEVDVPG
jgi:uncharacterized protein (TIGR03118 family)